MKKGNIYKINKTIHHGDLILRNNKFFKIDNIGFETITLLVGEPFVYDYNNDVTLEKSYFLQCLKNGTFQKWA